MSDQQGNITAFNVKIWFKCRSCKEYTVYFRRVEDFLEHKKDQHSDEFQNISCIVFEERENTDDTDSGNTNLSDLPSFEDVNLPVQEDEDVKSEFEPCSSDEEDNLSTNRSFTTTQAQDLIPDTAPDLSSLLDVPTHSISDPPTTRIFEANLNSRRLITLTIPRFIILNSESTTGLQNGITLPSPSQSPSLSLLQPPKPSRKSIPIVRLQRLTPTEIKTKSSASSVYLKRRPSFHSKKSSRVKPKSKKSKSSIVNSIRTEIYGPLVCQFCNKTFRHRSSLVLHLPVHSGNKPYKCSHPNCPLAFRIKNELTTHVRRDHTTKNPFFIFPKPKQKPPLPLEGNGNDEESNDSMSLRDWLLKQKSTEPENGHEKNFILLDPDPSVDPDPDLDIDPTPGSGTTEKEPFIVSPENPIKCRLCAKKLKSEPEVKVHVTHCWFQNKKKHRYCIPCDMEMCNLVTYTQHTLKYHLNPNPPKMIKRSRYRHRNKEEIKAKQGPTSNSNATQTPTERPVFYCEICARKYYSLPGLKLHGESHKAKEDQNRKYVCEFCGTDFIEMASLKKHLVTHTDVRPFPCTFPDCGLAFKTEPVLRHHLYIHTNFKPFKCTLPDCPASFITKYKLQKHLVSRAHTGPPKNFRCEQDPGSCRKAYLQKAGLDRHLLVAHGVGGELVQYECSVCSPVRTFNWKLAYDKHMMIHSGERPFECSWEGCSKSYRHKNLLVDHERKHTGTQLYKCHICDKPFDKRVSLECHVQTHNKF